MRYDIGQPAHSVELLQSIIDGLQEPIFAKDLQHRWIACNQAFCELIGEPWEAVVGHSDPDYLPPEQADVFWRYDDQVYATGQSVIQETVITSTRGITRATYTRKAPLYDEQRQMIGLCGIVTDLTEIKQRQERIEQLEASLEDRSATIEAQRMLLSHVAVPVIQIWEGIVLLPLVGLIDSYRAQKIMGLLLETVAEQRAQVLIVDITGVPLVDTAIASHLIEAVQAARLLGCESVLVGISPYIAQTIVQLGVDFSYINTRPTLQQGLAYGLERLGYRLGRSRQRR